MWLEGDTWSRGASAIKAVKTKASLLVCHRLRWSRDRWRISGAYYQTTERETIIILYVLHIMLEEKEAKRER